MFLNGRSYRRAGGAVIAASLVSVAAVVATAPAVSADEPSAAVPTLEWHPCGDDFPGAECAIATVPMDYGRPNRATTTIALARVPATDQEHKIGTVFVNPGGPGGSGVALVLFGFGQSLEAGLDGRFDIVGFDPRGVGASDPLHCFDGEEALNDFLAPLPLFPYRSGQYGPFFDAYSQFGARCLDGSDPVAAHMSTADVARDMDLLRQAVGDEKLTYLGFSYGSYLGNTYANLFPNNVRALVIDGVLDPRLWSSGRQIESDRVATEEEFGEFLRLCDEAGPDCAFFVPGGSRARWEALADAIEARPIDLGDFLYTYDFLISDAAGAMYAPEVWGGPEGAGALLDLLADAALGDQAAAAKARGLRGSLIERLTPATSSEPDYDNGFEAYYGNQCADTQYPRSFTSFKQVGRYAEAGSRFGPYWWWYNNGCSSWPVARDRYIGPWTARTSAPVLVVGNYFDGVTDYAGAVASSRLLKNSRLLSYAGWGHTAYGRSECATEHINAYLVDATLPPAGTVCPANPNPFVPAAARASNAVPQVGLPPAWSLRPR